MVKGLDYHLAETFGRTHDVGWIHRFISTDQDETFTAVYQCCISSLIGTDGIVLDCLAWAVFHQWYMLMSCCMVYHFRTVCLKDLEHQAAVTDRTNSYYQVQIWIFLL